MIIDASVAFKWTISEPDSPTADRLLERSDLLAPWVLRIELGYALTKRVRQRSLSLAEAYDAWHWIGAAPLAWRDDRLHQPAALELSLRLGASFYDCLYLALAIEHQDRVITADEHFVRAVRAAPDLRDRIWSLAEATI